MTSVAVLAHSGKELGGGLGELRRVLESAGVTDPLWYEVPKSKKAPKVAAKALKAGADLVFVWGGDGMVQRCMEPLARAGATLAILPAGTANLLATNLGIPKEIEGAVQTGLHGARKDLDLGSLNGERFAVMAGVGLDALMIRDADGAMKDHVGRLAYLWTGAKHLRDPKTEVRIKVDGNKWFKGKATCVLFGNVGKVMGGLTLFDDARPDDGRLDLGLVTAKSVVDWGRTLGRTIVGDPDASPFVRTTSGKKFDITLSRKTAYELDGGERAPTRRLRVKIRPGAIRVCVPEEGDR